VAGDGRLGAEAQRPTSVVGDGVGIDASGPAQAQNRARGAATWRAASGGGGVTQRRPRHRRKRRRAEVGWISGYAVYDDAGNNPNIRILSNSNIHQN
jgi:hypothetical protein